MEPIIGTKLTVTPQVRIRTRLDGCGDHFFVSEDRYDLGSGPAQVEEYVRFLSENYPDLAFEIIPANVKVTFTEPSTEPGGLTT